MRILFITPYPAGKAPSQRFRFEQYLKHLRNAGNEITFRSFLSKNAYSRFYLKGKFLLKFMDICRGFINRWLILTELSNYDYVFIHREMAPIGPPLFEWIASRVFKSRFIFDFDDAIWMSDLNNPRWKKLLKQYNKVGIICSLSSKVVCSNAFLHSYVTKFNSQVDLIPTTIDTHYHKPISIFKSYGKQKTIVGWTGSHSTLKYIDGIEEILDPVADKYPVEFLVICNEKPKLQRSYLYFKPWRIESEIPDLLSIDIGIMPMPDNDWTKGKAGFKLLQYMALEIPPIASPVGVNTEIITDGENGFLCESTDEWQEKLIYLIENPPMREIIGREGRKTVCENYSVQANLNKFLDLFRSSESIKNKK